MLNQLTDPTYGLPLFCDGASEAEAYAVGHEEWRPVVGHSGYEVSSNGRFRNVANGRTMRGSVNWTGYVHIGFTVAGKQKWFWAHRVVAEAFVGKPPGLEGMKLVVNHKDGDRANNAASNLEWVTNQQNVLHWRRPPVTNTGYSS